MADNEIKQAGGSLTQTDGLNSIAAPTNGIPSGDINTTIEALTRMVAQAQASKPVTWGTTGLPIKPNILQFLEEDNGTLSSTRLAFLIWVLGTFVVWCITSWHQKALAAIPDSVQVILGVLMTGKVVQKMSEAKVSTITSDASGAPGGNG